MFRGIQEGLDFPHIIFLPVLERVGGLRIQEDALGIQNKKVRVIGDLGIFREKRLVGIFFAVVDL